MCVSKVPRHWTHLKRRTTAGEFDGGGGAAESGAGAGQEGLPLAIGTLRTLHSEILREDRPLSIRLPSDYGRTPLSYPVAYLLYGDHTERYFAETVFSLERLEGGAEIPEFILVGIHNTDRYGNLPPFKFDGSPGGADVFMDFLEKEFFPEAETIFFLKVAEARVEFVKDAAGTVTELVLTQGGQVMPAKKIK